MIVSMRNLRLLLALALAFGAASSAVVRAGPADDATLLSCTGRSGGVASRKSNLHTTPGNVSATPTPEPPGVAGSTDARAFVASGCTSRHDVYSAGPPAKITTVDDTLTVSYPDAILVTIGVAGRQTYTGTVSATLVPVGGAGSGCSSWSHTAHVVAGSPESSASDAISLHGTVEHACTYKLVVSSNGIGTFDGFVRRASV
jgi:hypothetical protein